MILDRILANKYLEVARRRSQAPIEQLREQALTQTPQPWQSDGSI